MMLGKISNIALGKARGMDARHAQSRPFAPPLDGGSHKRWADSPSRFHKTWCQVFPDLNHLSCEIGHPTIVLNDRLIRHRGLGIQLTDTSVALIEKEKARVFPDRRAFPEVRTAAGPVVIRDYPSRKKDPDPAVTPQTVPLTAPRLANQEQTVQMSRPTASNGRPHCRVGGRSGAPGSAPGLRRPPADHARLRSSRRPGTQACRSRRPCLTAEAACGAEHPCPRSPRRRT